MFSATAGRFPGDSFTVDTFDPLNNKKRIDLAFSAAGADFGANYKSKPKTYDVDHAIQSLLKNASNKPKLSKKEALDKMQNNAVSGYSRWMDILSPDSAIDSYK